jgi:hypothetical protein
VGKPLLKILNLNWQIKMDTLKISGPQNCQNFSFESFRNIWLILSNFVETCSFWVIIRILKHLGIFDFARVVPQISKYLSVESTDFSF